MKRCIVAALALLVVAGLLGSALADVVVFTGDTNVRSSPSLNGAKLGSVRRGSSLSYMFDDSTDSRGVTWYCVWYNNQLGWVSSKYSHIEGEEDTYDYADDYEPYGPVYVSGDSNIRESPNLNGRKLTTVPRGTYLEYWGECSVDSRGVMWYLVKYYNHVGWISSKYSYVQD